MQELIEAGYVYIAKPPLYKLTQGKRERYIEKESELEETLLGDKLEKFEITDHAGQPFKLTDTRWQRYSRLLKQYEGWASALRPTSGTRSSTSSRSRRSSTSRSRRPRRCSSCSGARTPRASRTRPS